MTKVVNLREPVRQLAGVTDSDKSEIMSIDARIHALYRERDALINTPVSLDDLMGYIKKELDRRADRYTHRLAEALTMAPPSFWQLEHGEAEGLLMQSVDFCMADHAEAGIVYVHRDAILSTYRKVLSEVGTWPAGSVPVDTRRQEVARIELEINALREERQALMTIGLTKSA